MGNFAKAIAVISLMPLLGLASVSAAEDDALVGTWTLAVDRSKSDGPLPAHESRVYSLEFTGAVTVIVEGVETDGTPYAYGATGDIDGKTYPIAGRDVGARILGDSITWRRIDPMTIEMDVKKKGETLNATRHAVSADGKTLTVTEDGVDGENKPVHATMVYDKQ